MVKRITIAVPDELHEQLQEVKGEINVSKICQERIMKAVNTVKAGQSDDLIEFLRASKEVHNMKYQELGKKVANDAIEDKEVDFDIFLALDELAREWGTYDADREYSDLMAAVDGFTVETYIIDYVEDCQNDDTSFDADAFARGFVTQAVDVWNQVKDKI